MGETSHAADEFFLPSFLPSFLFLLGLLSLSALLPVDALRAEVTVQLAVPGDPATQPVKTVEITGSQIDAVVGGGFSPIVSQVFQGLATLRSQFAAEVKANFEKDPDIRYISSAYAEPVALKAVLRQMPTEVALSVSGLDVVVSGRADVDGIKAIFCPSVDFSARLKFSPAGSFRFSDLGLNGLTVGAPDVEMIFADCNGLFGPLVDLVFGIFGPGVGGKFEQKLEDGFRSNAGATIPAMFSLSDLAGKIDQAVPAGPVKDKVMQVVDRFLYLASQPASLQLEVKLHPDLFGAGNHLIALTASSIAPQSVVTVDYPLVDWFGGTAPFDVYLRWAGSTWQVTTTNASSWVGSTNVHSGTKVLVVSHNPVIPGLKSFPAEGVISFVPGGPDCPTCQLR